MDYTMTLQALERLKVETGSLACLGCGYEHNCGVHGCAIIRQAEDALRQCVTVLQENEAAQAELGRQLTEAQQWTDKLERDLASCLVENCTYCLHNGDNPECDCECLECQLSCYCRDCVNGSKFQWRGLDRAVPEEQTTPSPSLPQAAVSFLEKRFSGER